MSLIITDYCPKTGPVSGGTIVTIIGSGFYNTNSGEVYVNYGDPIPIISGIQFLNQTDTQVQYIMPDITQYIIGSTGDINADVCVVLNSAFNYECSNQPYIYTQLPVTPATGTAVGGDIIVIIGTGFLDDLVTDVQLYTPEVEPRIFSIPTFIVNSDTKITAITDYFSDDWGSTTTYDIVIKSYNYSIATYLAAFTFVYPTITSISPDIGPTSGNTSVTIHGTNLYNIGYVYISIANAPITYVDPCGTYLIVTTGVIQNGGNYTLTLRTTSEITIPPSAPFTYVGPPTILTLTPNKGLGGTKVKITGTNYIASTVIPVTVTVNGYPALIDAGYSSTELNVTIPAKQPSEPSIQTLIVSAVGGTVTKPFTYVIPTVDSVSPNLGSSIGGTDITITGTNFYYDVVVKVGPNLATNIVVVNTTTITATTPYGTVGLTDITVADVSTQLFTYVDPYIISIIPPSGPTPGGTVITITGQYFYNTITSITIDGNVASFTFISDTQITAVVPLATVEATVPVIITWTPLPTITSITIDGIGTSYTFITDTEIIVTIPLMIVPVNVPVIITWTQPPTTPIITIGGTVTSYTFITSTQITVVVPRVLLHPNQIVIITWTPPPIITATSTYTYDNTVVIDLVYPSGGPTSGNTPITINGRGFYNPIITIGGNPLLNVAVNSTNTVITGTTPPGNTGRQPLIIICNGNQALSYFKYFPPLPKPPYHNRECPGPPYNATNFNSDNPIIFNKLVSYAKNSPNYPWDTGVNPQEIYRSQQNTIFFNTLNEKTADVKNDNNKLIANGKLGNMPYPSFKSQAERLMYIQGLTLNAARNKITGQNPSGPMGVPCSTIYNIINSPT